MLRLFALAFALTAALGFAPVLACGPAHPCQGDFCER